MMAQNRYQRRRMYTRIAMGKNRAMDVVSGESSGTSGQLLIIYPMLLALQISQFVIGACHSKLGGIQRCAKAALRPRVDVQGCRWCGALGCRSRPQRAGWTLSGRRAICAALAASRWCVLGSWSLLAAERACC